ncbi:MAG: HAD family hydrolase [Myxococcaceae bacterium]
MAVAFFDFDKTLISVNSAHLWVRLQWKAGHLSKRELLSLIFGLLKYRLGFTNLEQDFRQAIYQLKGYAYETLELEAEGFYHNHITHLLRPGALEALEKHRQSGDQIVILTTSPKPLAICAARDLKISHCLSTELEIDEAGKCTGNPIEPMCFGAGKVELARQWLSLNGATFSDSTFYTDSYTDLPMLEVVGSPVVVNPDVRLLKAAKVRCWPVVDWGRLC